MNMQSMLKQAQKMQSDMLKKQETINQMEFEGSSSIVTVKLNGKKELVNVKISADTLEKDDIEMLQDMLLVAINDAMKKIDKETESKMGAYTKGIPGLF